MKLFRIAILFFAFIVLYSGFYVLEESEQAIITQFGQPVGGAVQDAGLHFKIPIIQKTHVIDKWIMEWDGNPKQIPTKDKKYIWVDTFARWRISDPLKFFQTVRNETFAHSRLDDVIDGTTRDIISLHNLIDLVRNSNRELTFSIDSDDKSLSVDAPEKIEVGRVAIEDAIFNSAKPSVNKYGIELIDVKIKRVNYIEEVRRKVYERMVSERNKIAARYRSEGQGKAAEIIGKMQRNLDTIQSGAYKNAQEIIGRADAEAIRIYAAAYNQDPNFYQFLKTLESYKETLDEKSTLIISTDSEFYKYIKNIK